MSYMRSDNSEVLNAFGKIMQDKDSIKKMASVKTAEQKSYDVTGKEDLVHEAHPQTAKVNDEVVENIAEQQRADREVAEKSAKGILVALYKLAKRLKAEKNTKAYSLVKETFLDLSKSLKK